MLWVPNFATPHELQAMPTDPSILQHIQCRVHTLLSVPRLFSEPVRFTVVGPKPRLQYDACALRVRVCATSGIVHAVQSPQARCTQASTVACVRSLACHGGPRCGRWGGGQTCGDRLVTATLVLECVVHAHSGSRTACFSGAGRVPQWCYHCGKSTAASHQLPMTGTRCATMQTATCTCPCKLGTCLSSGTFARH